MKLKLWSFKQTVKNDPILEQNLTADHLSMSFDQNLVLNCWQGQFSTLKNDTWSHFQRGQNIMLHRNDIHLGGSPVLVYTCAKLTYV